MKDKEKKSILKNKKMQVSFYMFFDVIIFLITSILALKLRFDFNKVPEDFFLSLFNYLFIDILIMFLIFSVCNLYSIIWEYASINELSNIFIACLLNEAVICGYKKIINIFMPNSYFIIHLLLMIIFISTLRYLPRIIKVFSINNKKKNKKTMVIGAGEAGRLILDEVNRNEKDFNTKIVCFIDDDKNKIGSKLRGIPIFGNREKIKEASEKFGVDEIIIAMPAYSKKTISEIFEECQKTDCKIKILPSLYLTMNQNIARKNISKILRPISYDDFLGRDQKVVDMEKIKSNLKGKTILVTGGGGSIGSELSRQIAKSEPKALIIFDIYENNAYSIQQELLRDYPNLDLRTIIGSVRDIDRLEKIFKEFKPDQVFHAAAHKHVPLMEVSPNEAVKNNCLGTLNVCKLAAKYKTERLVLISTDKAVKPTNVMGATKRICEMIIQEYNKISPNTEFVAVRFGNVLGSNGSVIPLFLKQIENGGPVTVTDKKMRRFFMTIPEAVSLVLLASVKAKGGEIFVLDMGEPVLIYDLARKLIEYKGLIPDEDIKIEIIGLRPGEKLYEEILMDEEGLEETEDELIHIGRPLEISKTFLKDLDNLIKDSYKNNEDIKEKIAKIVTTYKIDKERRGK